MGIDPAWGSSAFGIVVTQFIDEVCQVLHAEEYQRPDYNEMLSTVWKLIRKYEVHKIYIDGAMVISGSYKSTYVKDWGEGFDQ